MSTKHLTLRRFMCEIALKNLLILILYVALYLPISVKPVLNMPENIQESVISFMGFLMAAAIIGAFELSYTRTDLNRLAQRYLAHLTKFTLYSSILLLTQIAVLAIEVSQAGLTGVMLMASFPVIFALIFYDLWDALRAIGKIGEPGG